MPLYKNYFSFDFTTSQHHSSMTAPFLRILTVLALLSSMTSCLYQNEEELYPKEDPVGEAPAPTCDTINVSYSATVLPLLQRSCIGCHGSSAPSGGVVLSTYQGLVSSVNSGAFYGSISHAPGFSRMPKGAGKLPDCDLAQINAWIQAGAPEN